MRSAMTMSAALHAAIFALAVFGLPVILDSPMLEERPIVVELLQVAEETTPSPPEPEPPKEVELPEPEPVEAPPPPEPPKPPKPEPVKAPPPPPEPPKPEPVKAPPPEPPKPPPPEPETKVALAVPEPEPKPKLKPKPKLPPKPVVKPAPQVKKVIPKPRAKPRRKTEDFDADRIAALLDKKLKQKPRRRAPPKAPETRMVVVQTALSKGPSRPLTTQPLTLSEVDAIRMQIERCWSVPAGARDAENLQVTVHISLNLDGSLSRPPRIVDSLRMERPGEEFFRAAAESARRAVLRCSPLKNLPFNKYERWRDIELTFDPKGMLG